MSDLWTSYMITPWNLIPCNLTEHSKNHDLFKSGKYSGEKMKHILSISGVKTPVLVFCVVKALKDD